MKLVTTICAAAVASTLAIDAAQAVPDFQIYIDGATFNDGSETWVAGTESFQLWVIGKGTHPDVKLTASYFGLPGALTFSPTTAALTTDPSTPSLPTLVATGTGAHPVLSPHSIFNDASLDHWDDYLLGDFDLTDSQIADFDGSLLFPVSFPENGQINVYEVEITGWGRVHFDVYSADGTFAPFSHDGEFGGPTVGVEAATWSAVKSLY